MVLIRGYAGSGKTRLFDTFEAQLVQQNPAQYVIRGKFDMDKAMDPFSTLVDAFSDFWNQLLARESEEELAAVKKSILEAVGSEGRALTNNVPALVKILGEQPDVQDVSMSTAKNRLRYHFQAFFEATNRPIIMFLDDLQWADLASFDLVTALMTDSKLKYFLLSDLTETIKSTPGILSLKNKILCKKKERVSFPFTLGILILVPLPTTLLMRSSSSSLIWQNWHESFMPELQETCTTPWCCSYCWNKRVS
jgi:predicted ATPase